MQSDEGIISETIYTVRESDMSVQSPQKIEEPGGELSGAEPLSAPTVAVDSSPVVVVVDGCIEKLTNTSSNSTETSNCFTSESGNNTGAHYFILLC